MFQSFGANRDLHGFGVFWGLGLQGFMALGFLVAHGFSQSETV